MFDLFFDITELPRLPTMISHYGVMTPAAVRSARSEAALDDEAINFWRIGPRYSLSNTASLSMEGELCRNLRQRRDSLEFTETSS